MFAFLQVDFTGRRVICACVQCVLAVVCISRPLFGRHIPTFMPVVDFALAMFLFYKKNVKYTVYSFLYL